ncbi:hypothetical protein TCAL_02677 [Tigriopus californicus]|uniref:SARAH domain-containing protein n=1 Tax=Tigriopus californicus TaxID=6832 RepID=A0A553PG93_TIGCA|nr:uncharacterized protein LOC131881079 [Tigriopus californicus]TRY76697.1 hypothetical protein TCAL_02677 [Tigriopus californicus]|eukprot:TCALIF_02677-PA protein Name:"Protein of unknown function" AED:0.09 eAED:0.09 QI:0/1/0.5/1/1/1/2/98/231
MLQYRKQFLDSDLKDDHILDYIAVFNRRLTKRLNLCKIQADEIKHDQGRENVLSGGVRINFRLLNPVLVKNSMVVGDNEDVIITQFKFSTKCILVLPATNQETCGDLLEKVIDLFHILIVPDQTNSLMSKTHPLLFYERELSLTQQDIFYRQLEAHEIPLNLTILWSLNQERKSLVITDHNPNLEHFARFSMEQLQDKLESLQIEENEAIARVRSSYEIQRAAIDELLNKR